MLWLSQEVLSNPYLSPEYFHNCIEKILNSLQVFYISPAGKVFQYYRQVCLSFAWFYISYYIWNNNSNTTNYSFQEREIKSF
jgi:hypothetical protein